MKKNGLDIKVAFLKDYIHGSHSFYYENGGGFGIDEYKHGVMIGAKFIKEAVRN